MKPILDTSFAKNVKHYIETLEKAGIDLSIFYTNLDSLQIEYVDDNDLENKKTDGNYNVLKNNITINKRGKDRGCIYHELNHCASNRKDGIHVYTGFSRKNLETKITIGSAINEGFTEVIAGCFFGKAEGYIIEQFYVKRLIDLIGFEKMSELYFTADFDGFIDQFSKYVSEEEVYTFIALTDRLFHNQVYNKIYSEDDIQDYMTVCSNILIRGYKNRLLKEDTPLEEKQDSLLEYVTIFSNQTFSSVSNDHILTTEPSVFIFREAFDDIQIEYIESGHLIDIAPHINKQKRLEKADN